MLNKKITHFAVITKMKNDGKHTSDLDHNIEKASSYAQKIHILYSKGIPYKY